MCFKFKRIYYVIYLLLTKLIFILFTGESRQKGQNHESIYIGQTVRTVNYNDRYMEINYVSVVERTKKETRKSANIAS
jgi:hypothetical protein